MFAASREPARGTTILFASAEAFRSHNVYEKAACIILDINLKVGQASSLRRDLKAAGIYVPVIYMTARPLKYRYFVAAGIEP